MNQYCSSWVTKPPSLDRIIVTACAYEIPSHLIEQLDEGGIMIVPVGEVHEEQVLKKVKRIGEKFLLKILKE